MENQSKKHVKVIMRTPKKTVILNSRLLPIIHRQGYELVKRENNQLKIRCKKGHLSIKPLKLCARLGECEACKPPPPPVCLLKPFIVNTYWSCEKEVYDHHTKFTLKCKNGHTWSGNLKRFKKLKNPDCYGCWLSYNVDQITPVTKVFTDRSKINYLKDKIEVMELNKEGIEERKTYDIGTLLRKYYLITPLKGDVNEYSDTDEEDIIDLN